MSDLFPDGTKPNPAAVERAKTERAAQQQAELAIAREERYLCDVARRMRFAIPVFAARLMRNPSCDLTAALFAEALRLSRTAKAGLRPW